MTHLRRPFACLSFSLFSIAIVMSTSSADERAREYKCSDAGILAQIQRFEGIIKDSLPNEDAILREASALLPARSTPLAESTTASRASSSVVSAVDSGISAWRNPEVCELFQTTRKNLEPSLIALTDLDLKKKDRLLVLGTIFDGLLEREKSLISIRGGLFDKEIEQLPIRFPELPAPHFNWAVMTARLQVDKRFSYALSRMTGVLKSGCGLIQAGKKEYLFDLAKGMAMSRESDANYSPCPGIGPASL